jgi:(4S)-4-hydroxy-5-phosphonooxypentane-2,3-dione isomerase
MIAVIATFSVRTGMETEFEQLMAELAAQVRSLEPGCQLYQLCKSSDPGKYMMIERYTDQLAFGAHTQTPYFQAAMPRLGELLEGRAGIKVLTEVG